MVMGNPLNTGQPQQMQQQDLDKLYQEFVRNPMKYLIGLNIPSNITTPQQAVEYCMSAGKVPPILQQKINAMLGRK
jgi:hypothetical protein